MYYWIYSELRKETPIKRCYAEHFIVFCNEFNFSDTGTQLLDSFFSKDTEAFDLNHFLNVKI